MFQVHYLNPISKKGTDLWKDNYQTANSLEDAQAVLVRSAAMHDLDLPENLLAVARAGAGVNNIPLDKCAEQGIVVFNTPGSPVNYYQEKGLYKYTYGESIDYNKVLRTKRQISAKFKGAFIIAFKNGKKMDVNQAIKEFKNNKK